MAGTEAAAVVVAGTAAEAARRLGRAACDRTAARAAARDNMMASGEGKASEWWEGGRAG